MLAHLWALFAFVSMKCEILLSAEPFHTQKTWVKTQSMLRLP